MEIANALGPRPGHAGPRPVPLSGPRRAVLDAVAGAPAGLTVADVAGRLGLHGNTAREHLDALAEQGLILRDRAPAQGRGRPAWRYRPAALPADPQVREYAGLAAALADHIARTSPDPSADALAAGQAWGEELVRDEDHRGAAHAGHPGEAAPGGRAARRHVVSLLARLGFDPQADDDATSVALRSCPLLETARRHPEVVCSVHLGIARGALSVLGGEPDRTDLRAFAEPGACRLLLAAGPDRG
ncbi:MAG: helix-turn-helix domain-containing protein [Kineosporiaceae bacterium]